MSDTLYYLALITAIKKIHFLLLTDFTACDQHFPTEFFLPHVRTWKILAWSAGYERFSVELIKHHVSKEFIST